MPTFANLLGGAGLVTQAQGTVSEGLPGPYPGLSSVSFTGTGARASAGDVHRFNGTASFSIELWVHLIGLTTGFPRFVSTERTDGNGEQGYDFEMTGTTGVATFKRVVNSASFFCGFGTLVVGRWHHLVGTYDGSLGKSYLDSVLVTTSVATTTSIPNTAVDFRIGAYDSSLMSCNSRLAGLAVYGAALSLAEVQARFRAGRRRNWAAWRWVA